MRGANQQEAIRAILIDSRLWKTPREAACAKNFSCARERGDRVSDAPNPSRSDVLRLVNCCRLRFSHVPKSLVSSQFFAICDAALGFRHRVHDAHASRRANMRDRRDAARRRCRAYTLR
jgi:hypothetical protein